MNPYWPEAILLMAGALRAGLNLDEALDLLARESPESLKAQLNSRMNDKFKWFPREKKIERLFSDPSLGLVRAALLLSHQTGAEQARILETCARLLREHREFEEKVKALTAQGRFTAWTVGLSPAVFLLLIQFVSPEFTAPLFQTKAGWGLLVFSALSVSAGLFFVHRMARIEP